MKRRGFLAACAAAITSPLVISNAYAGGCRMTGIKGPLPDGYTIQMQGKDDVFKHHINHLKISVPMSREEIYELGRKGPYYRHIKFPVNITCPI